jgi:hypothetical protein
MSSQRQPFSTVVHCPVVQRQVTVSGTTVFLPGASAPAMVANKSCSNIEHCLKASGSIEAIPSCLLHSLQA